ncbi:MAG: tRNA guanosine(34) transglycosylase Tgt [Candidatus Kerfeldbacteria bacterium]|nr:tRNA guanosine(34) transglycosylase Tgt [Candidatus Kerfeldbacteria bacterium]
MPTAERYAMMMDMAFFTITSTAARGAARTGTVRTVHGDIETPNFMPVATRGVFHGMELTDAAEAGAEVLMCNTHHLNRSVGADTIAAAGGLHTWMKWDRALATDSGGFQVFSLGWGRVHGIGKHAGGINARPVGTHAIVSAQATIDDQGVIFSDGEQLVRLTPETAISIQEQLGADIIFAFDECTSPLHDEAYNAAALERTHRWAKQCLTARTRADQAMFGIVQGGTFERLREASAQFIGQLPFEGIGIGGSFGQHEMVTTLDWVMPHLPLDKPRHLLGIGWLQDILLAVDRGIDLFDCVEPLRRARHQHVLTPTGYRDVTPVSRGQGDGPLVANCDCVSCRTMSASDIRGWCKARDYRGSRALAIHNVRTMIRFMAEIRSAITTGRWPAFLAERLSELERRHPSVVS